jgi:chloramphenicol 3-O-phosphotransferase
MADAGRIIVVTGATGSGKTTTCLKFVSLAEELWLHFGADYFLGQMVPRKFVDGGPRCSEAVHMEPDDAKDPEGPAHLALGKYGAGLIRTMHEMVAAAARAGQNVIMDHVTTVEPPLLQDCVARLADLPVLFVGLRPPEALLGARIDERIRKSGLLIDEAQAKLANDATRRVSKYMADQIFSHDAFDLVIDNATMSPREVVGAILGRLEQGPGEAFPALAERFRGERLTGA